MIGYARYVPLSALFEIITPPSPPAVYPITFNYTAVPVGSLRGVGTSPSAAQFVPPSDATQYPNYADGPTIRSRGRGKSGTKRSNSGKVRKRRKAGA